MSIFNVWVTIEEMDEDGNGTDLDEYLDSVGPFDTLEEAAAVYDKLVHYERWGAAEPTTKEHDPKEHDPTTCPRCLTWSVLSS
jgi:hypothetical protein